jgi:hypothetical protein
MFCPKTAKFDPENDPKVLTKKSHHSGMSVIVFVCLKRVLWAENTKINHGQTNLCNISIFESILLCVPSEVE